MIHQFIFAGPKPGLSADAFNSYWLNFHAVDYAAKIRQIRQYLIATRLPIATDRAAPFFEGAAEIWLENDVEQIASLQSPEFLQGARADEPRWAAFWQTFVLDTDPEIVTEYSGREPWPEFVKLYIFLKRRPDLSREAFRDQLLADRRAWQVRPPSLARHLVGFARAALYGFGEPRFDAIEVLSFQLDPAPVALSGIRRFAEGMKVDWSFVDSRYVFIFLGQEHWIIRPGQR